MGKKQFSKYQSVKVNFIMNAILKMSAFIFPLITFPYVSRVLGATGNGKITFVTSVISYFSMIAQLGIPTYGIRICAQCRNDKKELNKTVQELIMINLITVICSYILLLICVMQVPKFYSEKTLFIIVSANIILNAIGMEWLFQALEQYTYITFRNLLFKVISIILMFVCVRKPEDYIIYGIIGVIGSCGSNIFNVIYASKFLEHRLIGGYNFKRHLKPILNFFMLSISIAVYTSMDSVMLGFMSNDSEVGYYAAATKMKTIVVSAVTALGAVLLPRMSNLLAEGKSSQFYVTLRKSLNCILLISVPASLFFIIMSKEIIGVLAGQSYYPSIVPMQIISITIILIALSNITGMQILVPTGQEKITTRSTVYGAISNLIVNACTIAKLGATGAAIGTVVAELVVLIYQSLFVKTELKNMVRGIEFIKILLANILALVALICFKYISVCENHFLNLIIGSVVYFGIYGLFLIVTKEKFVWNIVSSIVKKLLK